MAQTERANIAYYTVVQDDRTGWTGGLLVLNAVGRPLEFQCTLPVRTSRAHEILFGPTLRDHLIGEVIGPLLVKKCRHRIQLLCCDQPEALRMKTSADCPIVLVDQAARSEEGPISDDSLAESAPITLAGATLRTPMGDYDRVEATVARLLDLPDAVEPFERIREAIKEAQSQIARAKTNTSVDESSYDSANDRAA